MDNVSGEYEKSSTLELKEALPHDHLSGIRIYAEEYEIYVIVCAGAAQVRDFLNAKDARKYGRGYTRVINYLFSQILGTKNSKVA